LYIVSCRNTVILPFFVAVRSKNNSGNSAPYFVRLSCRSQNFTSTTATRQTIWASRDGSKVTEILVGNCSRGIYPSADFVRHRPVLRYRSTGAGVVDSSRCGSRRTKSCRSVHSSTIARRRRRRGYGFTTAINGVVVVTTTTTSGLDQHSHVTVHPTPLLLLLLLAGFVQRRPLIAETCKAI